MRRQKNDEHTSSQSSHPDQPSRDRSSSARRNSKKVKITILLCVILMVLLAIPALGYFYISSKLDLIDYQSANDEWIVPTYSDIASSGDLADDIGIETDEMTVDEDAEVVLPEESIFKDKNVLNILLLGTDERRDALSNTSRADAILVLSLNKSTNAIKLVSLERGMVVQFPNGRTDILTHAFHYGGPQWMLYCVQTHFNLDVEKYVRVNFDVFEKLVDAVGGVDIELTQVEANALNHRGRTNTFPLSREVSVGMNHLNGYEALQYCRLRYTDSDWHRIVRQRKTIAAIKEQCKTLSLSELNSAADTVLPMVQTNLEKDEIFSLMLNLPQYINGTDIEDMTIPASGTFKKLTHVDFVENSRILHEFLYGESDSDVE